MTVCPFCKKAVAMAPGERCPSCGKGGGATSSAKMPAAAPPAPAQNSGDGWGDEMEISHGSSGGAVTAPSSYSGGSLGGLGDDDDEGGQVSLELDAPARAKGGVATQAGSSAGTPMPTQESRPGAGLPLPARSQPHGPGSDPAMSPQQSQPNLAPPSAPDGAAPQQSQPGAAMPFVAPGPPDAAIMIARFPAPPQKVWETPLYAMKVLWRQFELRQDIASLRKRRSPDVPLYERALKMHDGKTFLVGLAISIAAFTILSFLFFLPVIIRFVRDPD